MSPKPVIVCLEANFPGSVIIVQPMFPCIEQRVCDDCYIFLKNMADELGFLHFDLFLRANVGLSNDMPDD